MLGPFSNEIYTDAFWELGARDFDSTSALTLPVDGAVMILGYDITGSQVWADITPPAIVTNSAFC